MPESKPKLYISMEDATKSILSFIGSDEYEDILSNIIGGERGGFMTGLAIAVSVMMNSGHFVTGLPLNEFTEERKSIDITPNPEYFNIFFNDLNKNAQKRLLKYVGANDPKDENWDIDMCPIAMFYREPSKEENKNG